MVASCVFLIVVALLCVQHTTYGFGFVPGIAHRTSVGRRTSQLESSAGLDAGGVATGEEKPKLTQKEYYIAVRNRLFAVEEQIWLHEYASARPDYANLTVAPYSEKKYDSLLRARGELMEEYPLTKLYTDLQDAQQRNLTYAAMYLGRLISTFQRQMPLSMDHINEVVVLSHSGQVANLMRGQGSAYHRLLPGNVQSDRTLMRQFQQPTFSTQGKYLAIAEMYFREQVVTASGIAVYEVPKEPEIFGKDDSTPVFNTGDLPSAPFFVRFSPNDETLAMLCSSPGENGAPSTTSLVLMDWAKAYRKDGWAGGSVSGRHVPRTTTTVMKGSPMFFSYTTSSPKNATIVAHCQQQVADDETKEMKTERGVWALQKRDTAGVCDYTWDKISSTDSREKWSTPICHSAGGGDSVLVVEDGWLVSKSVSRWKRNADGSRASKKIMEVKGQAQFLVSPDSSRCVVLQEDINVGHYSLKVIEGESALDPSSPDMGKQYDLPCDKLTVAFWFSPDSTKVLLLTAAGKEKNEVIEQKSGFRVALNADMQWSVLNFPLMEFKEYQVFKPTPYFMKTNVPFFSQYAQVFNPWAPDSKSFIYVTPAGLSHTPLVDSKVCLGLDSWQNQGASYGTWSRC